MRGTGLTGSKHVLDGAKVDKQRADRLAQVCHFLGGGRHDGRRTEREGRVRGLVRDDIVRDLTRRRGRECVSVAVSFLDRREPPKALVEA